MFKKIQRGVEGVRRERRVMMDYFHLSRTVIYFGENNPQLQLSNASGKVNSLLNSYS